MEYKVLRVVATLVLAPMLIAAAVPVHPHTAGHLQHHGHGAGRCRNR